jgi:hypothetical protein
MKATTILDAPKVNNMAVLVLRADILSEITRQSKVNGLVNPYLIFISEELYCYQTSSDLQVTNGLRNAPYPPESMLQFFYATAHKRDLMGTKVSDTVFNMVSCLLGHTCIEYKKAKVNNKMVIPTVYKIA